MEAQFPNVAKAYGANWANVTAADQENIFKPLQLKESIEARKEQARILSQEKSNNLELKKQEYKDKTSKLSDTQISAFTDLDKASQELNNLVELLGNNSNYTGKFDGAIPDMLVGSDQVAFRSALGKYKDAYRKAITGAGAGPKEIQMLEKRLPSEYDTFNNFKSKAQEGLKDLQRQKTT